MKGFSKRSPSLSRFLVRQVPLRFDRCHRLCCCCGLLLDSGVSRLPIGLQHIHCGIINDRVSANGFHA